MTVPYERSRAVLATAEFLRRLASPYTQDGLKKIPTDVRAEARALLRHYPLPYELHVAAKAAPTIFAAQDEYDLPDSADAAV